MNYFFGVIYKTIYLTLGHNALAVPVPVPVPLFFLFFIYFFLSYQQLNCFDKVKEAYKIRGSIFLCMKVTIPGTPGISMFRISIMEG